MPGHPDHRRLPRWPTGLLAISFALLAALPAQAARLIPEKGEILVDETTYVRLDADLALLPEWKSSPELDVLDSSAKGATVKGVRPGTASLTVKYLGGKQTASIQVVPTAVPSPAPSTAGQSPAAGIQAAAAPAPGVTIRPLAPTTEVAIQPLPPPVEVAIQPLPPPAGTMVQPLPPAGAEPRAEETRDTHGNVAAPPGGPTLQAGTGRNEEWGQDGPALQGLSPTQRQMAVLLRRANQALVRGDAPDAVAKAFYAELAMLNLKAPMVELNRLKTRLAEAGLDTPALGVKLGGGGSPVERALLLYRRGLTMDSIRAAVAEVARAHGADAGSVFLARPGKWAARDPDMFTLADDIDFAFVGARPDILIALRDAFNRIITERSGGLDMVAVNALATARGQAGHMVYLGIQGREFADDAILEMHEGVEEIDFLDPGSVGTLRARQLSGRQALHETVLEEAGIRYREAGHEARSRTLADGIERSWNDRRDQAVEPFLSMEMARHLEADIIRDVDVFATLDIIRKGASYLRRSNDQTTGDLKIPAADPGWARLVVDVDEQAGKAGKASAGEMVKFIDAELRKLGIDGFDMKIVDGRAVLESRPGGAEAFLAGVRRMIWNNVSNGLDARIRDLTEALDHRGRAAGPETPDDPRPERRTDTLRMISAGLEVMKHDHSDIPPEVRTRLSALARLMEGYATPRGYALPREELDRLRELLKEAAGNEYALLLTMGAVASHIDQWLGKNHDAMTAKLPAARRLAHADARVDTFNSVLDVLDDTTLAALGERGVIELDLGAGGDGKPRPRALAFPRVDAIDQRLNQGILGRIGDNTAFKAFDLAQEGDACYAALMRAATPGEAFGNLAGEIFRRRLAGGGAVEAAVMEKHLRAGVEAVYLIFPPPAVPEGLYALGASVHESGGRAWWKPELESLIDGLYDQARFEAVEGRPGAFRLKEVTYRRPHARDDLEKGRDFILDPGADQALDRSLRDSDAFLNLMEKLRNHGAAGDRVRAGFGEKADRRWEELRHAFVLHLVDKLEKRHAAEIADTAGKIPGLYDELTETAAKLEIGNQVLASMEAAWASSGARFNDYWAWLKNPARAGIWGGTLTEAERDHAARAVTRYRDVYQSVLESREKLEAAVAGHLKQAGLEGPEYGNVRHGQRLLTGIAFLSGKPEEDEATARQWSTVAGQIHQAAESQLTTLKGVYIPQARLDNAFDAQTLGGVFYEDVWLRALRTMKAPVIAAAGHGSAIEQLEARRAEMLKSFRVRYANQSGSVAVRVLRMEDGRPGQGIGNAVVTLAGGRGEIALAHRGDGLYTASGLQPGPYVARVRAEGFKGRDGGQEAGADVDLPPPADTSRLGEATVFLVHAAAGDTLSVGIEMPRADGRVAGSGPDGAASLRTGGSVSGMFPSEPFNGMQISYSASGCSLPKMEDRHGPGTYRNYAGRLGSGTLTVSGTARMGDGHGADLVVTVSAGGKTAEHKAYIKSGSPGFNSESFNLSVPIPDDATEGGFSIRMDGHYGVGVGGRGLGVSGSCPADGPEGEAPRGTEDLAVELAGPGEAIPVGQKADITARVKGGRFPYEFAWSGAEGKAETAVFRSKLPGEHTVSLGVADTDGKSASASARITVAPLSFELDGLPADPPYGGSIQLTARPAGPVPEGAAYRYLWQASEPGIEFQPAESGNGETTVTFGRMGAIQVWARVVDAQDQGTVGETERKAARVAAPRFTLAFTPPDAHVGQEVRARIDTQPEVPARLIDYRWFDPASANRKEYGQNGGEIGFRVRDGQPLALRALARVPHYGDEIAGITGQYTGHAYEVKIGEPRGAGPKLQVWVCDTRPDGAAACGMRDLPPGRFATFQDITLKAEVSPAPPAPRYRWSVDPAGSCGLPGGGAELRLNCGDTGRYRVKLEVLDADGLLLGQAERQVAVSVRDEDIKQAPRSREAHAKVGQARQLAAEGRLDEAIDRVAEAAGLDAGHPEAGALRDRWTAEREQVARRLGDAALAMERGDLDGAGQAVEAAKTLHPSHAPVLEAEKRLAEQRKAREERIRKAGQLAGAARDQIRAGRLEAALVTVKALREVDGGQADGLAGELAAAARQAAGQAEQVRDFEESGRLFEIAVEADPADAEARIGAGNAPVHARRMKEMRAWQAEARAALETGDFDTSGARLADILAREASLPGPADAATRELEGRHRAEFAAYRQAMDDLEARVGQAMTARDCEGARARLEEMAGRRPVEQERQWIDTMNRALAERAQRGECGSDAVREAGGKPVSASANGATLRLDSGVVEPGAELRLQWSAPARLPNNAWIGLIPAATPHGRNTVNDQHDIAWKYIDKVRSGTMVFTAPRTEGRYDFRLSNPANGRELASLTFTVKAAAVPDSLTLAKSVFAPNESIIAVFTASPGHPGNSWVGLLPADKPHGRGSVNDRYDTAFKYLEGKTRGELTFIAPSAEGRYDLRMNETTNDREVASVGFTVAVPTAGAELWLPRAAFRPGEEIRLRYKASPLLPKNSWIGLIPSGIPHGSTSVNDQYDVAFRHLDGKAAGEFVFTAPSTEGAWDFRLGETSNDREVISLSFWVDRNAPAGDSPISRANPVAGAGAGPAGGGTVSGADTAGGTVDADRVTATGSLAWVGLTEDRVGEGGDGKPNGAPDGHFRLDLDLSGRTPVTAISVWSADANGRKAGGQVWHSQNAGNWLLGVFQAGRQLNDRHVPSLGEFQGRASFDLYANNSGWFKAGQTFLVEVTGAGGRPLFSQPLVLPAAADRPVDIAEFAWAGMAEDRVGEGGDGKPNGAPDGHFRLALDIPVETRVDSISLWSADAGGQRAGGQVWHSREAGHWMLGLFREGRQLNDRHVASLGPLRGRVVLDLYANNSGWFKADQWFLLEVASWDGKVARATLRLPAAADRNVTISEFQWLGMDEDRVGEGGSGKPDGTKDGRFRLALDLAEHTVVRSLSVWSADAGGSKAGGQAWHSQNSGYRVLGVFQAGRQLNDRHVPSLGDAGGRVVFDLYANGSGWFREGQHFLVEVATWDGRVATRLTRIGPGQAAAPPPPAGPVTSPPAAPVAVPPAAPVAVPPAPPVTVPSAPPVAVPPAPPPSGGQVEPSIEEQAEELLDILKQLKGLFGR